LENYKNESATIKPPERNGSGSSNEEVFVFPTTVAQRRFWLLDQIQPGNPALNLPLAARLAGRLDREALEHAANELVNRHEVLRTSFQTLENELVQIIHPKQSLRLNWHDLTLHPESERQAEADQLLLAESKRSFVLTDGLLLRGGLIKLSEDEHVLMLTMHHIVCDGWSNGILMRELAEIYSALIEGRDLPAELPIQYADYAQWQHDWLAGPAADEQRQFWKSQLKGVLPFLSLPTDRPRKSGRSNNSNIHTLLLPKSLTDALKALCVRENLTPFMLFFATYATLLFRYTGQRDMIIGSPAANRNQTDLEGLIGLFSNPLVLRLKLSGELTVRELLAQVKNLSLAAFDHQMYPFEMLLDEIQTDPHRAGLSWPQAYIIFQKAFMLPQEMPGLTLTPLRSVSPGTMFEWMLGILERGEGIRLQLEYNTDLHDESTIDRVLHQFRQLLETWLVNLDVRIDTLPILTPGEYRQSVQDWNETRLEIPVDRSVSALFAEQVSRTPGATAVQNGEVCLTYLQLQERANQLAHFLLGHGLRPGGKVGLMAKGSALNFVIGFLGVIKAGGCCVVLNPRMEMAFLEALASDNGLELLIVESGSVQPHPCGKLRIINLDADAKSIGQQPENDLSRPAEIDQAACVYFTSGFSGPGKGAIISHRSLLNSSIVARDALGLHEGDRVGFSQYEMLPSLLAGATLVQPAATEKFSAEGWLQWSRSQRLTVAALPTFRWHEVVQLLAQDPGLLPATLRLLAIGGSQIAPKALVIWQGVAAGRIRLLDRFLLTEAAGAVAFSERLATDSSQEPISIVKPARNFRIYLLDANLKPVPVGVPGDLYVGGDNLFSGYLASSESPEKNLVADPFSDQPGARLLKTFDTGRFLPGGGIEWLGRHEDLANTYGFQLELKEVWSTVVRQLGVWDAVVVPQDISGEKSLVAYWVATKSTPAQSAELRAFISGSLPTYMVPKGFVSLASLPLTPDGRLDRKALPKPELKSLMGEFFPPKTPAEVALAKIWCDILGLKQVGIRERFFEIGGHSLMAMQLVSRIKRELSFDLPLRTIFQHPTIEKLALQISQQPIAGRKAELIQLQAGGSGPDLIFLVDEGSFGLFKLAYLLDKNPPLYISVSPLPESALKAAAENRLAELPSMESLAAGHVALIKSRASRRPIILVGHCFGGELAFEVAHQLEKAGERVKTVLMLDSWMARPSYWWKKKTWLSAHFKKILEQGPSYLWRKSRRRINLEKDDLAIQLKLRTNGNYDVHVPWFIIMRIYRRAVAGCHRQVLPLRGFLFLSRDDWQSNAYRKIDNTLGAKKWFADGIEVIDVPGDHVTVLDEVHLPQLAITFNAVLSKLYGFGPLIPTVEQQANNSK
jgi:non-ribosomal peptide synthetase component F/thioesterase domain-containing protein/acyl carrier protein